MQKSRTMWIFTVHRVLLQCDDVVTIGRRGHFHWHNLIFSDLLPLTFLAPINRVNMVFLGETLTASAGQRRGAVALTTTAHGSIVPVDEDEDEGQKRPAMDNEDADDGGDDAPTDNRLEDQMNNEHLKLLQNIFEEADEDSGGGLDMDEFRNAMRRTMGAGVPDHELDMLFMKVDTNCDGGVDWDEYLTYMLLEYQEREMMAQLLKERPLPSNVRKIETHHRDLLQKLCFVPSSRRPLICSRPVCNHEQRRHD